VLDLVFLFVPAQSFVADRLQTFAQFPVRQKPASFSLERVLETLQSGSLDA
jgi:arylsulfatase